MRSHHPKSSNKKSDTIIWYCRWCLWSSEPASIKEPAKQSGCLNCSGKLCYIEYHKETEQNLADQILKDMATSYI